MYCSYSGSASFRFGIARNKPEDFNQGNPVWRLQEKIPKIYLQLSCISGKVVALNET